MNRGIRTADSIIADYIDKVPSMGVVFEAPNIFVLITHQYTDYGREAEHLYVHYDMHVIAKNIEKHLKELEFKKVKVTPVCFDYFLNGMGSGNIMSPARKALYSYKSSYEYHAE